VTVAAPTVIAASPAIIVAIAAPFTAVAVAVWPILSRCGADRRQGENRCHGGQHPFHCNTPKTPSVERCRVMMQMLAESRLSEPGVAKIGRQSCRQGNVVDGAAPGA
jgi:hypothetical protein